MVPARIFTRIQRPSRAPVLPGASTARPRHADIQWIAAGAERILYIPVEGLAVAEPYSEESDILFFEEPKVSTSLLLNTGDAAVFFPEDAHKRGCMAGARHDIRKVVVKIRF